MHWTLRFECIKDSPENEPGIYLSRGGIKLLPYFAKLIHTHHLSSFTAKFDQRFERQTFRVAKRQKDAGVTVISVYD
jgi:hypothetical protein